MMNHCSRWLLIALLCLPVAHATAADQRVSLEAGFKGFFRPGQWTPVTLLIERKSDKTKETQGTLTVQSRPREGDTRLYRRQVELSNQQKIRTTLYAQISEDSTCNIEFSYGSNLWTQGLNKDYLRALEPYQRLVLMVNREGYLMPRSATALKNASLAHMLPDELPDMWQALESVDLIVFAQDPSLDLTDEAKREALLTWVKFGGRVLCVGGPATASYGDSFLKAALPVNLKGTREVAFASADATASFPVSDMELKPGATVLWSDKGIPLLARWNVGRGEVAFSAVNLEHVDDYAPMAALAWDSMVYAPGSRPQRTLVEEVTQQNIDFAFGKAARLPSIVLVVLLLGTYTVLVGPVNFYLLRKRRRLELAWLTIPAIVAVFSILTYMIGAATKGGLLILREMDYVYTTANENKARAEKVASLFSPKKRAYTMSIGEGGGTLSAFAVWDSEVAAGNLSPGVWVSGQKTSVAAAGWPLVVNEEQRSMMLPERLFGQWTSQNFAGQTAADLGGVIAGSATIEGESILINLENRSQLNVLSPFLRVGQYSRYLPSFAPGEKISVAFPISNYGDPAGWDPSPVIGGDAASYQNAPTMSVNLQDQPKEVSSYLMSRLWHAVYTPSLSSGVLSEKISISPCLVGWIDKSPAALSLDTAPDEYAYGGMLVCEMPLNLAAGRVSIPANLSTARLVDYWNPDNFEDYAYRDKAHTSGSGELTFVIGHGLRDERLSVEMATLSLDAQSLQGYKVTLSCFDFQAGRWQALRQGLATQSVVVPLSLNYFSPVDGNIFMKLTVEQDTNFSGNREPYVSFRDVKASFAGQVL